MRWAVLASVLASPAVGQWQDPPKPRMVGSSCGQAWLWPGPDARTVIGWRMVLILSPSGNAQYATIMVGGVIPPTGMGETVMAACTAHVAIMETFHLNVEEPPIEWDLEIPYDPSLVGTEFMVQAAVSDPASPIGWYVTNGVSCTVAFPP